MYAFAIVRLQNPNPSRTSHNTMIEILWTAVPVIILVVIAYPLSSISIILIGPLIRT